MPVEMTWVGPWEQGKKRKPSWWDRWRHRHNAKVHELKTCTDGPPDYSTATPQPAKEGKMGKMSYDRVEFLLKDKPSEETTVVNAAMRAFGMTHHEAHCAFKSQKMIRCRPSQFARFIIYRSEGVTVNQIASLEAKLVPDPEDNPIDVSKRAADHSCS